MNLFATAKETVLDRAKALIDKKLNDRVPIEYNDVYEILLDDTNGEITKNINNVNNLKQINEDIKALMDENINIVYKQIYDR